MDLSEHMLSSSDEIAGRGVMLLYVDDVAAERRRLQGLEIVLGKNIEGDYSTLTKEHEQIAAGFSRERSLVSRSQCAEWNAHIKAYISAKSPSGSAPFVAKHSVSGGPPGAVTWAITANIGAAIRLSQSANSSLAELSRSVIGDPPDRWLAVIPTAMSKRPAGTSFLFTSTTMSCCKISSVDRLELL